MSSANRARSRESELADRVRGVIAHPGFAIVGLGVSLLLVSWVVSGSYYFSDDFLNFAQASRSGFRAWVNGELFGHWLPARKALDWGLNASRPVSWAAAVAVLLEFVGVTALFVRLIVLRLTGSAAWSNIALVLMPLTAAVPATVQWYAGAAQVIPASTFAMAVVVCVVWLPSLSGVWRVLAYPAMAGALAAGLLFDERTAVVAMAAPALLPLAVRGRRVWTMAAASYAVFVPLLGVWYLVQSRMTGSSEEPFSSLGTAVLFLVKAVVQNAFPALFGWVTRPAAWGEDALWGIGGALIILVLVLLLRSRHRGRSSWILLVWLGTVLLTAAPTAVVRAEQFGVSAALEPRYIAMAMPLGLVALIVVAADGRRLMRAGAIAASAIAVALGALLVVNLLHLHAMPAGKITREWSDRVVVSAAAQGVDTFYNAVLPEFVVPQAFYPYNLTGSVLPQILSDATTLVTGPSAAVVRADGTVERVTPEPTDAVELVAVDGFAEAPSDGLAGCYRAADSGGRLSFEIGPRPADVLTVIDVLGAFTDTGMRLVTGADWSLLRDKTAGIGGHPPTAGAQRWVTTEELSDIRVLAIDVQPGQQICIDRIDIGSIRL